MIQWSEKFLTGDAEIDSQHNRLVDLFNDFEKDVRTMTANETMPALLVELQNYAIEHFSFEEGLLEQAGYPDLQNHKEKHQQALESFSKLKMLMNEGEVDAYDITINMLETWIHTHILGEDRKYIKDLKTFRENP